MNTEARRPFRQIICSVCGCHTRTQNKSRDICRSCYRAEPSSLCKGCGLMKHQVSQKTGLCPHCTELVTRPVAICSRCSKTKVIYNQVNWLCQSCNKVVRHCLRKKANAYKVKCSVCGEIKSSQLLGQAICKACYTEKANGIKECTQCNKLKVIHNKTENLCKQCSKNRLAHRALRNYVMSFNTSYLYNKILFDLLTTTIDWESVTDKINQRFKAFGQFLQSYQLTQPLTWDAIEEALPELEPTKRNKPKYIRACLLELGHLLVALRKLEPREAYIARRNALLPIKRVPEHLQALLYHYTTWLWEQKTKPGNIRIHLEALGRFWLWGAQRGIKSPEEVQPSLIDTYLLTLYWQWQCSACQQIMDFEPCNRKALKVCTYCGAVHSLNKIRRYSQNTVRGHRSKLIVFFDWAKYNRMVVMNPVQRKVAAPSPNIQHYEPEVIKQLCKYILTPDTDPVEALVLYLIIFHAFSVWELRHAEIPVIFPLREDIPSLRLAEAYYLIVPKREPSRGNRSPGRPSIRLDFPLIAQPWLQPLLERFEYQRQQILENPSNQYLLVTLSSAHRNMPAGVVFIWEVVRRASMCVLGAACNPNTLRKTAGVMLADQAGGGVLRWMGWQEHQAFGYTWMPREVVHPKQLNSSDDTKLQPDLGCIDFPSVTQTNPPNTLGSDK